MNITDFLLAWLINFLIIVHCIVVMAVMAIAIVAFILLMHYLITTTDIPKGTLSIIVAIGAVVVVSFLSTLWDKRL